MGSKKRKLIHLVYENERGTTPPYFWQVHVDGKPLIPEKYSPHPGSPYTTERHAEDIVVGLLEKAGVKDPSNIEEWHAAGFDFKKDSISGWGNWPYRSC